MLMKLSRMDENGDLSKTKLIDVPFHELTENSPKKIKKERVLIEINGFMYILNREGKLKKVTEPL